MSRTRPASSLREAAWAIVKDAKGMEETGHAASVRWARALLELDGAGERESPARRQTGGHVHGYTKDETGLWYCLECREVYVGPIPGGYQRAEPGRAISADSDGRRPWRATWRETDPQRRCWTCGRLPDHHFDDGSPGYRCIHDPVWP